MDIDQYKKRRLVSYPTETIMNKIHEHVDSKNKECDKKEYSASQFVVDAVKFYFKHLEKK